MLKSRQHIPYVFEIRDLWPEVPIQMKIIRNPVVKGLTRFLEKKTYAGASRLIALSPGIEESLKRLSFIDSVYLCPNMSDCTFFKMDGPQEPELIRKYDLEGKFVISYFGAIGPSNALDYLMDIARIADKKSKKIVFLILGDGPEKKHLLRIKELEDLKNVHFIDFQNKYILKKYLSLTDAAYLSFANFQVFETNSPNKFFDALASGKLIISNVNGWIRDLIEEHSCGFYYHPEEPSFFFEKIESFMGDPEKLKRYQLNARKLAETQFDRRLLIRGLFNYLGIA
jgi:glycosyltransferase involved in cell wall biosynthesis